MTNASSTARRRWRLLLSGLCILALSQPFMIQFAWACRENAMLVFDASGSMALFRNGRPKIDIAREAAADVLPDVTRFRRTGLVTYSGGRGLACADINLRVQPRVEAGSAILAEMSKLQPNGATPLSEAVEMAAGVLKRLDEPGVIVLVTDGLENCGGNVCELGRKLQVEGGRLRVHVISFFLHGRSERTIMCLAEQTSGTYTSTTSLDTLREALHKVLGCARISRLGRDEAASGKTEHEGTRRAGSVLGAWSTLHGRGATALHIR